MTTKQTAKFGEHKAWLLTRLKKQQLNTKAYDIYIVSIIKFVITRVGSFN